MFLIFKYVFYSTYFIPDQSHAKTLSQSNSKTTEQIFLRDENDYFYQCIYKCFQGSDQSQWSSQTWSKFDQYLIEL